MSGTSAPAADASAALDRISQTPRRRFVLAYLLTSRGRVTVDELAAAVDTWERLYRDAGIHTSREEHRIGLREVHLPLLADVALVDFDRQRGLVELAVDADQLSEALQSPSPRRTVASISKSTQAT